MEYVVLINIYKCSAAYLLNFKLTVKFISLHNNKYLIPRQYQVSCFSIHLSLFQSS